MINIKITGPNQWNNRCHVKESNLMIGYIDKYQNDHRNTISDNQKYQDILGKITAHITYFTYIYSRI